MKRLTYKSNLNKIKHLSPKLWVAMALVSAIVLPSSAGAQAQTDTQTPQATAAGVSQPTISGPLSLADAVQTALKNSPMVQAAGDQIGAAQARVGMARAMTKPQLSASAFGGTSTMGDIITTPPNVMPSGAFSVPDRAGVTGQASLMVPLYTGGRLSGAVKGAEELFNASKSDRAVSERNTALETRVSYHRALLAQATTDVYRNLVKQQEERVRIAEVSYKEGRIAKYDLLRNQTGLAEAQQQLVNAERDAQLAMIELKTVLGVSPGSDVTLSDQLGYEKVEGTPEAYTDTAVKNRPELASVRARIASAEANIGVAKSAYKPQVYAGAMAGIGVTADGTDTGVTAGITIGIPIIDGGLRSSAVREAEAMRDAMKRDEQQAVLAVQQDVNMVWAELQAAEKNVQLSEAAVAQADEDYRVIKLRYEAGKAVNVEVLDALSSLVRAQNNRLMALYEHNVTRDRLARAIGEL
ncbi:MAG: TolC family protein [Armatimonadota bacterium]